MPPLLYSPGRIGRRCDARVPALACDSPLDLVRRIWSGVSPRDAARYRRGCWCRRGSACARGWDRGRFGAGVGCAGRRRTQVIVSVQVRTVAVNNASARLHLDEPGVSSDLPSFPGGTKPCRLPSPVQLARVYAYWLSCMFSWVGSVVAQPARCGVQVPCLSVVPSQPFCRHTNEYCHTRNIRVSLRTHL